MTYTAQATDNFTAANDTLWSAYRGSNYAEYGLSGAYDPAYLKISNDGTNSRLAAAYAMLGTGIWIAKWVGAVGAAFTQDQGAEATIRGLGSTDGRYLAGPMVRVSAGTGTTANGYGLVWFDGTGGSAGTPRDLQLIKYTNHVGSVLRTWTPAYSDGSTLRLEATGAASTLLTAYLGGTDLGSAYTDSTSPHTTGVPGIAFLGQSGGAGPEIDLATYGNVTSGGGGATSRIPRRGGTPRVLLTHF